MIDSRLERFLPIRCVIQQDSNGKIQGLIENSFSMDWSDDRVNIFWSGKAYSNFGTTHELNAINDANYNCKSKEGDLFTPREFVIDPLADDSPIEIDWDRWLSAKTKFYKRNAPFKRKQNANNL